MTTITQGDTWPPLKGYAADENGALDLTTADALQVILKASGTTVTGVPTAIDPPEAVLDSQGAPVLDENGNPVKWNWQYVWASGDTGTPGEYQQALKVTWDSGTTPPEVEYIPNGTNPLVTIKAKLA